MAFWGTLALMRCVGSSPAAALSALRNRMSSESDRLEPQIYDDDGDDEDAVDLEPGTAFDVDPELLALVKDAEELLGEPDPKLVALVDALTPLIKKGANPVVFCRYLATAEHVRDGLRKAFPKLTIEAVTGVLTPDERRDRVADMATADEETPVQRILVATDCLSEGINLQQLFDTVVHYDLSWNPTRHQQREGRVDRFGQPAELVRSIMMFSPDSAIDGAVLDVILRKAEEIRKATGVTVPLPEERGPVTDALMASMMLRRGVPRQLTLDLRLDDGAKVMEARWRDASENEKRSRARFAQNERSVFGFLSSAEPAGFQQFLSSTKIGAGTIRVQTERLNDTESANVRERLATTFKVDENKVIAWVSTGRSPHAGDSMGARDLERILESSRKAGLKRFLFHPDPDLGAPEWSVISGLCGKQWKEGASDYWPSDTPRYERFNGGRKPGDGR